MSTRTFHTTVIILGVLGFNSVFAGGDPCASDWFTKPFLKGQGIIEDYATVSPDLVSLGDDAVPCLVAIAEKGEAVFDITCQLQEVDGGCRTWAIKALGAISTPQARQALTRFLETSRDSTLLQEAVLRLSTSKDAATRETLLKMLNHSAPEVRAAAVTALVYIRNPADIDALLEATLSLPDEHLYRAAVAVSRFGDTRLADPLRARVQSITDPTTRRVLEQLLERMRKAESDPSSLR